MTKDDFSAEDDSVAQETFENAAKGELARLIESLKKKEEEAKSSAISETSDLAVVTIPPV